MHLVPSSTRSNYFILHIVNIDDDPVEFLVPRSHFHFSYDFLLGFTGVGTGIVGDIVVVLYF